MSGAGRGARAGRCGLAWLALLGLGAVRVAAQPGPAAEPAWRALLSADEQTLYLARVSAERTVVHRRGVTGRFEQTAALNAAASSMVAAGGRVYVFVDDGRFYSTGDEGWLAERNLPLRALPLDMAGSRAGLVALVASPPAGELPRVADAERSAASRPFDPAGAPLSIVYYDGRGWAGAATGPPALTVPAPDRLGPRLALFQGELHLFWWPVGADHLAYVRLEPDSGRWSPPAATPAVPGLDGYWLTTLAGVPTVVVVTRAAGGVDEVQALRLLGGTEQAAPSWRLAGLRLSELPAGAAPGRFEAAAGFNQHVALLMVDPQGAAYVRFGRVDAAPAEATLAVRDVFAGRGAPGHGPRWLQTATLAVLFGLLLLLVLVRRGALAAPLELPEGCAVALLFQRLLGCAIDLGPIVLGTAALLGLDPRAGFQELLGWAVGTEAAAGRLPALDTVVWWAWSAAAYAVYAAIMEALTHRTVGKVLTGTRLLSVTGTPPGVRQVVVRNLLRFVELMPPLWVLGFLVILSRNRQRVGDMFARTVVVRRAAGPGAER